MDLAELGIKVDSAPVTKADDALDKFSASAKGAENATDKFNKTVKETESSTGRFSNTVTKLQGPLGVIKGTLAAVAASFVSKTIGDAANQYTEFTNRLKVAGATGEAFNKVQDRLFAAANRGGAPINALGQLYARASLATQSLGASQDKLLSFVDGVTASLKVQGGSSEAASGALLQLSQALGSGVVRAEEFNSILEGAPTIAQAAAAGWNGTGVSIAQLRNMVINGQVSSKQFFDSFLEGSKAMQEQADGLSVTWGQAFTVLGNGFIRLVGTLDQMLGVSSTLASGIQLMGQALDFLAGNLDIVGKLLISVSPLLIGVFGPAIVGMVVSLATVVGSQLVAAFSAVIKVLDLLRLAMLSNPITAIGVILATVIVTLYEFREELGLTSGKWAEFWQLGADAWEAVKNAAVAFWDKVGPLLQQMWSLSSQLWQIVGQSLVAAWQYLGPVVSAIIEGWVYLLQKAVDLLNAITGADASSAIGQGIDNAATGAADKIKRAHVEGGNAAASALSNAGSQTASKLGNAMSKGGDDAAARLKATQDAALARYEELNGKAVKEIGGALIDGGKYFFNQATGELTKAGAAAGQAMNDNIQKGGNNAATMMGSAIEQAGNNITYNLSTTMSDILVGFQTFGGDLIQTMDQIRQTINGQIAVLNATANNLNAQANLADANAQKIRHELFGSGSKGGSGSGSYSGSSSSGSGGVVSGIGGVRSAVNGASFNEINGYSGSNTFNRAAMSFVSGGAGFANGGEFTVPGKGNTDSKEVSFHATGGERIKITPSPSNDSDKKDSVTIQNLFSPEEVLKALSTRAGNNVIKNIIKSDPRAFRALLGV